MCNIWEEDAKHMAVIVVPGPDYMACLAISEQNRHILAQSSTQQQHAVSCQVLSSSLGQASAGIAVHLLGGLQLYKSYD